MGGGDHGSLAMHRRAGACAGRWLWVGARLAVCCLWRGEGWRGWAGVNELRVGWSHDRLVHGAWQVQVRCPMHGLGRCTHIRGGDVVDFAVGDETQGDALLIHLGGGSAGPGGGGMSVKGRGQGRWERGGTAACSSTPPALTRPH